MGKKAAVFAGLIGLVAGIVAGPAVAANAGTGNIDKVDFKAALESTYLHSAGGGQWGDGSHTYLRPELESDSFKCNDWVSYLMHFTVTSETTTNAKITLEYTADSTGQSGVALAPSIDPAHLLVQTDGTDSGTTSDGRAATIDVRDTIVPYLSEFEPGATKSLSFTVGNLIPGAEVVIRSDAQIHCQPGSRPTGNLQAKLMDIVSPAIGGDSINGGSQTVNLKVNGLPDTPPPPPGPANLAITKSVSANGIDCNATSPTALISDSQTVKYCYTVTNNGGTTAVKVHVVDDNATPGTISPATDDDFIVLLSTTLLGTPSDNISLAPGATAYGISGLKGPFTGDLTGIAYTNTAKVTADDVDSKTATATVTSKTPSAPSLTIVKTIAGNPATAAVDDVLTYDIVVTNTGNKTITDVTILDPSASLGTCPAVTLAKGESVTCHASYKVTSADRTAGHHSNTATVSASDDLSGSSSVDINVPTPYNPPAPVQPVPGLTITKSQTGANPAKLGDTISYQLTVRNSGQTALTGVNVADTNATIGACSVTLPASLAVGASFTCAASHIVTPADVTAGKVDNVATAGANGGTSATSNTVTTPLVIASLSITKALDGAAPTKLGDVVTYKLVATNTGNVLIKNATIADANATIGSCTPANGTDLAPGATITCAATHPVTADDMTATKVDNVATVSGNPAPGGTVSAASVDATSNVVTVPLLNPAISIAKALSGALPTVIGGYIHYSITVTNTGNVALHNVNVTDNNATDLVCDDGNPARALLVGMSFNCTAKHKLTVADVKAGEVVNVASVTTDENATAASGAPSSGAPGTVTTNSNPVITEIRFTTAKFNKASTPNGGRILLGAVALANPKLKVLAFTGDLDNVTEDGTLALGLALLISAGVVIRRRFQRR